MPVELVAFLDLVAELIAMAVSQADRENAAPGETIVVPTDGDDILKASEPANVGPIPTSPGDSHPHSRPSPTTPRRVTRRAPPKEAS